MRRIVVAAVIALAGCIVEPDVPWQSPEGGVYDLAKGPAGEPRPYALEGTHTVQTVDYDMGFVLVEDPVEDRSYPVRLLGRAWLPQATSPVVLLMHGQHNWCEGSQLTSVWYLAGSAHCRGLEPAWSSVPSHLGYAQVAQALASQGIAVVSIDANDVNAQNEGNLAGTGVPGYGDVGMQARAQLLLATLDGLRVAANGEDPENAAFAGRLDLGRIGLMGHSRGAEGATRAPSYAHEVGHWAAPAIRAVYSLAGTPRYVVEGYTLPIMPHTVAYASVIPYCDGDVWNLGNAHFHDAYVAAGHPDATQLVFMGANHNYYNAVWPEDDGLFQWPDDPYCGQPDGLPGYGRLSPEDQRRHQDVYLSAFFRLHLNGEVLLQDIFGGAAPPAAACPVALDRCPGLVHVSTTWRQSLLPLAEAPHDGAPFVLCRPGQDGECSPPRVVGVAPRLVATVNGTATLWIDASAIQAPAATHVVFRVAFDRADGTAPPQVAVSWSQGWTDAAPYTAALFPPPGDAAQRVVLHQVRIPADALAGTGERIGIRFTTTEPGIIHVADIGVFS